MARQARFAHEVRSPGRLLRVIAATTLVACDVNYVTDPADLEQPRAVAIAINPQAAQSDPGGTAGGRTPRRTGRCGA
jgi:hypothetical protein